jgi:hypothetical protein
MYFGTTIQYYTSTQQHNHNVFLHTHTLYKLVGATSPQHAANTSGGEFRSKLFQVFTASLGATRSCDQSTPPSDQSSLRTSSQISLIKRRNVVSIMSSAICRSSLSVGIRPAPKTGSQSVRGRSLWLGLRSHRAARQSTRNQIYIFGWPDDTLLDRLWFRNDPFGHEGVH